MIDVIRYRGDSSRIYCDSYLKPSNIIKSVGHLIVCFQTDGSTDAEIELEFDDFQFYVNTYDVYKSIKETNVVDPNPVDDKSLLDFSIRKNDIVLKFDDNVIGEINTIFSLDQAIYSAVCRFCEDWPTCMLELDRILWPVINDKRLAELISCSLEEFHSDIYLLPNKNESGDNNYNPFSLENNDEEEEDQSLPEPIYRTIRTKTESQDLILAHRNHKIKLL
jgi:hypothetical protein